MMEMTEKEFDAQFRETLDYLVEAMAENAEIDVEKFYGMTCFLENLAFFSPVIYGMIEDSKNK